MGTRRRKTQKSRRRKTQKSRRRKRKNKIYAKQVSNKYKEIQKKLENISTNMYNLLVEIFSSVEPNEDIDYTDLELEDLIKVIRTRKNIVNKSPGSLKEALKLLENDDENENRTQAILEIKKEMDKFIKSYSSIELDTDINQKKVFKDIKDFYEKIKTYQDVGVGDNLYELQKIMLEQFMDVKNWYTRNYLKDFNPLNILSKSQDYRINFKSIIQRYDDLYDERVKPKTKRDATYVSEIYLYNKKSSILLQMKKLAQKIQNKLGEELYKDDFKENTEKLFLAPYEKEIVNVNSFIQDSDNYLKLEKSSTVRHIHTRIQKPKTWSTYFGTGKFGKKLVSSIAYEPSDHPPEHNLYLFFKKVIKDMEYKPNPTSKPEHEIEIRKYLQKAGFVGPRPNMDENKKKEWYKDQNLKIGEFVEQPNGSTSHPDLWVQLSMLRLSIEAKSNQGYYPMYGKTPPPRETVYIFSSKKQTYPEDDIRYEKGRTTITFGHQLLIDDIRDIMKKNKRKIKISGKEMDDEINTLNNFSSIGMTSDVNIQHIGNYSNYWQGNRNILREQEVLFYNWLDPLGECNQTPKIKYICKKINIGGFEYEKLSFVCYQVSNRPTGIVCSCNTHKEDFESSEPFSGRSFIEMEKIPYTKTYYYTPEGRISMPGGRYICHMCLMKYYTDIEKQEYPYDEIKDVIYITGVTKNIWYEMKWTNYEETTWLSHSDLMGNTSGKEDIKEFWENIMDKDKKPDLKIKKYDGEEVDGNIVNAKGKGKGKTPIITNSIKGNILNKKVTGEDTDMFTIPEISGLIKQYNQNLWKIYEKTSNQ